MEGLEELSGLSIKIATKRGKKHPFAGLSEEEINEKIKAFRANQETKLTDGYFEKKNRNFLYEHSLKPTSESLKAKFSGIEPVNKEFVELAKRAKKIADDYISGERYTVVFKGNPGVGKTMLATCIANATTNESIASVYISMVMYKRLVMAFRDDRKQEALEQVNNTIKNAQVIILDDLGRESSMESANSVAKQSFQEALYYLLDLINKKAVIITTNNTGAELKQLYDGSIISRALTSNKEHWLDFKDVSDYRLAHN